MHLVFNGICGNPPELGSDEHLFLVACSTELPELWEYFDGMEEDDVASIVEALQRMGWGFQYITLH
jgi:hypothetical protein